MADLIPGKAIGAQRGFARRFNDVAAIAENLKGDFDLNPLAGFISVDRSNPRNPVIRLKRGMAGGGGGSSSDFNGVDYVSAVEWGALPASAVYHGDGYGFIIRLKHWNVVNGQVSVVDRNPLYIEAVAHSSEMDA